MCALPSCPWSRGILDFLHSELKRILPTAIWTTAVIGRAEKRGPRMSDEDLKDELERLRKENAALKKGASSGIRMKVSEKGALSIYGMGRFPVTLYKEQWLKLLVPLHSDYDSLV
jgi:hypothetical protein